MGRVAQRRAHPVARARRSSRVFTQRLSKSANKYKTLVRRALAVSKLRSPMASDTESDTESDPPASGSTLRVPVVFVLGELCELRLVSALWITSGTPDAIEHAAARRSKWADTRREADRLRQLRVAGKTMVCDAALFGTVWHCEDVEAVQEAMVENGSK